MIAPKNSRIPSQQIDKSLSPGGRSPTRGQQNKSQNVIQSDPLSLAFENNIERYEKLAKKKGIYEKYSLVSNTTLDRAINQCTKMQSMLESTASPLKKSSRLEDLSSTNIMKYHQLKIQKAKLMQVDLVRNQKKKAAERGKENMET